MKLTPTQRHIDWLCRFVARGWIHATRDDAFEQEAIDIGLRRRWLRRELGEAHFTPRALLALQENSNER